MASCCLTQYDHDYVYDPFNKIKVNDLPADFSATTRSDLITCCSANGNNLINVQANSENQQCRSSENQTKFHCVTYPVRKNKVVNTKEGIKTFNVTTISPLDLSRLLTFYNTKNLTKNNLLKTASTGAEKNPDEESVRASHCVNKTHESVSNRKNVIIKTVVSPNNKKSQLPNLKWHHTSFEPRRSRRKEIRTNAKKSSNGCGRQKTISHLPWPVTPLSQALHNLEERDMAVKETVSALAKSENYVKFKDTDPVLYETNSSHEQKIKELDDVISVPSRCKRQSSENVHVVVKSRKVIISPSVSHGPGFFEETSSDVHEGSSKEKTDLEDKMNSNSEEIENADSHILSDEVFLDLFGCDATKLLNEVCYADAIMQENISILDMVFKKPLNNNIANNTGVTTSNHSIPITNPYSNEREPEKMVIEPEEFLATNQTTSNFSADDRRNSIEIPSQTSIDFNGLSDTDSGIHSPGANSFQYLSDTGRSYSSNSETGSMISSATCTDRKIFFKGDPNMYEHNNDEMSSTSTETSLLDLDDNQIHIKAEPTYFTKSPPYFASDVSDDMTSDSNHDVISKQDKFITAKMVTVPKWKVSLSHDFNDIVPLQASVVSKSVKTEPFETDCCEVKPQPHTDVVVGSRIRKLTSCEKGKSIHLWEFIRDVLLNPQHCPSLIKWEDREKGVFKFMQSDAVAAMWGKRKQNPKMTYEKLSRAMRYYYNRGILERVDGRRLVYKFGPNSYGWRNPSLKNTQTKKTTRVTDQTFAIQTCQVKVEPRPTTTCSDSNNSKTVALKTFSIPLSTSPSWEVTSSDRLTSLPSADVFLCKQIKIATVM